MFLLSPFRIFAAREMVVKPEYHQLSTGGPRTPHIKQPTFGDYCIKATTTLQHGDDAFIFEGYLNDLSIIERVETKCKQHETGETKCNPVHMCFLGPMRECNKITMKNNDQLIKEWYLMD